MSVLSFELRVGTALSADWLRPFALGQTLNLPTIFVNQVYSDRRRQGTSKLVDNSRSLGNDHGFRNYQRKEKKRLCLE
jgi:hypothetical protein